jgi:hypothetical protein
MRSGPIVRLKVDRGNREAERGFSMGAGWADKGNQAMAVSTQRRSSLPRSLLLGFLAGFGATLTFHQVLIVLLAGAGAIETGAYSFRGVAPLGVPQVVSLAFWGGLWGCVWAFMADRIPRFVPGWVAGLAFGALVPTLVGWFVVAPVKGQPIAAGWDVARMWIAPLVNGGWGLGAALFYDLLCRRGTDSGRP